MFAQFSYITNNFQLTPSEAFNDIMAPTIRSWVFQFTCQSFFVKGPGGERLLHMRYYRHKNVSFVCTKTFSQITLSLATSSLIIVFYIAKSFVILMWS